jgi:DNA-binding CsgD family transcriptional regulator
VKRQRLTNPQLAVNYYDLGNAYKALNDLENTVKYTVLSSLADIRAATKETAAMHTLAKLLYEQGDIENAYVFVKQALDDAEFYGARQRKVEIGSILPLIAAARLSTVEGQRQMWLVYSSALTVLAILVLVSLLIIFKQLNKLKAAESVIREANMHLQEINHKLQEADKIKEEYIGYYFSNNSGYIDKIESFKKAIQQKVQSKKTEEIRYIINSINPPQEREELYVNFDKIFLKLFPDFVTTFNSYFHPDDRVVLKESQLLNAELRIFALIRLGIHDAEKIARILGYSVNTIYAYKNRVKSKSTVPNGQFEHKIMGIKTVPVLEE